MAKRKQAEDDLLRRLLEVEREDLFETVKGSTNSSRIKPWSSRAKAAEAREKEIQAKLDKYEAEKDLLIDLGGKLTPAGYRIVKYLWHRRSASLDDLNRECWDEPASNDTIRTAIRRTNKDLLELGEPYSRFTLSTKNEIVTLDRPDK